MTNWWYFFLFSPETDWHFMQIVSTETICMKCQNPFSGKNKKNISNCCLLKFLPSKLSINQFPDEIPGMKRRMITISSTNLASRNLERRIITASQVLCLSCISMAANFLRMMLTILSISFGAIGRVLLCSRRRFTTWVVNSLHAWK